MNVFAYRTAIFILVLCFFSACSNAQTPIPAPPTIAGLKIARAITDTPMPAPTRNTKPTQLATSTHTATPARETDIPTSVGAAPNQADTAQSATTNSDPALFPDQMQLQGKPFQAALQNFENGFMLWRSDLNCVYAIRDLGNGDLRAINFAERVPNHPSTPKIYGYCFRVETLANTNTSVTPPAGKFLPGGALGQVWNAHQGIRSTLGYATAPELGYTANYSPNGQLTLPNGKALACELDYGALTTYCTQQ